LRYPELYRLAGPYPARSLLMGEFVLNINGSHVSVTAAPEESLLSVLRNHLKLTGTHYGCGEGQCGACTVLLDGVAARSCLRPVGSVGSTAIVTIEGLEQNGRLTAVQQAFLDEGAFQCGYCTSGMIVSAVSLLRQTPHPTDQQIVSSMNGNVCRCGTYPRIVAAIRRAANGARQ
jgi:aerobic-type carbon monoxide dehydrogenase small subunit (CoxS/CutS family)